MALHQTMMIDSCFAWWSSSPSPGELQTGGLSPQHLLHNDCSRNVCWMNETQKSISNAHLPPWTLCRLCEGENGFIMHLLYGRCIHTYDLLKSLYPWHAAYATDEVRIWWPACYHPAKGGLMGSFIWEATTRDPWAWKMRWKIVVGIQFQVCLTWKPVFFSLHVLYLLKSQNSAQDWQAGV